MRSMVMTAWLAGASVSVWAADAVLIQGPQAAISAEDIQADSLRMPEEMRSAVLKRPQTVQQIGMNLYVRRVMADEAQKLHLEQGPEVQSALRIARDKILSDAYLEHLDRSLGVSEQALQAQARSAYQAQPERFKLEEQVRIRHILLEGKDEAKAQEILKELRAGADFGDLAKKHSIDKGTAEKDGDLGLFARGRMVPEFEHVAFSLKKVGELSEVVRTQFGLHILQLQEHLPARTQSFEEVRESLVKDIRAKMVQDLRVGAADKIREKAQPQTAAIEAFSNGYPSGK